mgnify:CR=1 FL=1
MNHSSPSQNGTVPAGLSIPLDQPGGGVIVHFELFWGTIRRGMIRLLFPGHIRSMEGIRTGICPDCAHNVIDSRDLKYKKLLCGYRFDPARDPYAWRDQTYIARHGWAEIFFMGAPLALLAIAGLVLAWTVHPAWMAMTVSTVPFLVFTVAFFRNPKRIPPQDEKTLCSPADGVVTDVDEVEEPGFPGGKAKRISIFLSVFNVHVNRSPVTGTVERLVYLPGLYLDARHPECFRRNEQLWLDIRDDEGRLWRVRQVAGAIARRIVCQAKVGTRLTRGDLYGLIKFGSRTEILWEATLDCRPLVQVGSVVRGGQTGVLQSL